MDLHVLETAADTSCHRRVDELPRQFHRNISDTPFAATSRQMQIASAGKHRTFTKSTYNFASSSRPHVSFLNLGYSL